MDFSNINWGNFGAGVSVLTLLVVASAAWRFRRQWTWTAFGVGLLHVPITLTHCVAPFRGLLDPGYVGYNLGLLHANPGIEVGLFAGYMLLGGLASTCIAFSNRPGLRNVAIVCYDTVLVLILLPANLAQMSALGTAGYRFELGEYVQLSGFPAMLIEVGLLLVPPMIGLVWAARRVSANRNQPAT